METVIGRLTSFAASTECITKALEENAPDESIIRTVSSVTDVLQSTWMQKFSRNEDNDTKSHENFQLKFFSKQLEEVVVGLWNAAVARQCAKTLSSRTNAVLRQLCYDLLTCPLCCCDELFDCQDLRQKPYLHRRIMMATKAGKNWLDVADCEKAEAILLKGKCDIEKLRLMVVNSDEKLKDEATRRHQEVTALNKHQLTVLCYLAESVWRLGEVERAYAFLQEASSLECLCDGSEYFAEKKRILVTSYNFGLKAAEEHKLENAIKWLQYSYECGKQKEFVDAKLMAQVLRLLAHVYCETGIAENTAKALCAVELANGYVSHPAGLHLRNYLW